MSSPYQVLIRTSPGASSAQVQRDLEQGLRESGSRVEVGSADREDAQDAQRFFRLMPNLSADVTPSRAGQEGAIFVALISWARTAGADIVILLDWELVAAVRSRALEAIASERVFFERDVLPSLGGSATWIQRT